MDVLVSNATLQWVPGHLDLLPRLLRVARSQAVGSPSRCRANFDEPSHVIRAELAAEAALRQSTQQTSPCPSSHDPAAYYDALMRPPVPRASTSGKPRTPTC